MKNQSLVVEGLQKTIRRPIEYKGRGLHTGLDAKVVFKPAPADYGIKFFRTDFNPPVEIPAVMCNVIGVVRGTTIGTARAHIHTVEHVLASLSGLDIDNLIIEVSTGEPPVGDGSALPIVETLLKAGIEDQVGHKKKIYKPASKIEYLSGDTLISLSPSDFKEIDCTIEYRHPALKKQRLSLRIDQKTFISQIAPARTYCFDYEIEMLKKKGYAKGGTLENTVVIGENKIHNKMLRFPDEFVRHKILDLMGDLYLIGKPFAGKLIAVRCGHSHNIAFAREVVKKMSEEKKEGIEPGLEMNIEEIQKYIPHRYPFLLVDRIKIAEPEKRAIGYKNVSINESYFQGHFPGRPIMPGVLIVESMAQTACILFLHRPDKANKLPYFLGFNEVKFRRPVFPGDQLRMDVQVTRARERGGKIKGEAYVGDKLVAEAEFMFALVER